MRLSDFSNLELNNAGVWPWPIKLVAVVLLMGAVGFGGYKAFTEDKLAELERVRAEEPRLRADFVRRQEVMANLEAYRAQIAELQGMLRTMLEQLPTSTEMPDLLEDISNLGRVNGLQFQLFRPENDQPRDFYAAKPITINARANYHQFGSFVSAVAALGRIVTVESAALVDSRQPRSGRGVSADLNPPLTINARLQTYRYLDEAADDLLTPLEGN